MALRAVSLAIFAALLGACAPISHDAPFAPAPPSVELSPVSLSVESVSGARLPTYDLGADTFVEGHRGQAYSLRLTNHSPQRYEAVVTVDGRDVVSGALGNPARQRGYVLEPYESIVIDGYRRSLDEVAEFYFSGVPESYSARRGSPQHVGVIGVALFSEKQRAKRTRPLRRHAPRPEPFPAAKATPHAADGEADMAYAPATEHIGTGYGADTHSPAYETAFQRRRRRRPDTVLTVYYDSREGLRARGVLPYYAVEPYEPEPYEERPLPYARPVEPRERPPWERDGG